MLATDAQYVAIISADSCARQADHQDHTCCRKAPRRVTPQLGGRMLFALFYVVAITILVLHFTGFLARHNLEWLVLVLAVATFPAVIYL